MEVQIDDFQAKEIYFSDAENHEHEKMKYQTIQLLHGPKVFELSLGQVCFRRGFQSNPYCSDLVGLLRLYLPDSYSLKIFEIFTTLGEICRQRCKCEDIRDPIKDPKNIMDTKIRFIRCKLSQDNPAEITDIKGKNINRSQLINKMFEADLTIRFEIILIDSRYYLNANIVSLKMTKIVEVASTSNDISKHF